MKKRIIFTILILLAWVGISFAETGEVTSVYYIYDTEASYAAVHASETGSNDSSSGPQVGQTTAWRIYRGYLNVTIPALGSCTSAYLYLYGDSNNSTTDFEIMVYEGAWDGTVSSSEWELWDGWVPDGPHTGTSFVDVGTWSTSSFTIGWNIIEFNEAGCAAILAAQGGTLQLALISKEEVDNDAPGDNEYVQFDGLGGEENHPYLKINDFPVSGTYKSYVVAGSDGYAYGQDATYVTQRDAAEAATAVTANVIFGQIQTVDPLFRSYRAFLSFPIPAMTAATACTLNLKGAGADYSDDNFGVFIFTSTYGGSLGVGDYDAFDGWQNGIAFDGTGLNETWNSSSFNANTWETIVFNAAGKAAVAAAQGGTLYIAVLSEEDYNRDQPGDKEYLSFLSSTGAIADSPYLEITYTEVSAGYTGTACGIATPANVCGVAAADLRNFIGVE